MMTYISILKISEEEPKKNTLAEHPEGEES